MNKLLITAILASLLTGLSSVSHAEDLLSMPLSELMQIEVITASRTLQSTLEAPASVHVVTARQIEERGYQTLKDVLRDLPGMETIEYHFTEFGTLVPVRGIVGNNKLVVLVNGVRVNPPGGEMMMFRSGFSVRHAERIEVVYGPGSTLYGHDAISALINVITKAPEDGELGRVELLGGTDNHKGAFVSFGRKTDRFRLSGYLHWIEKDLTDWSDEYSAWWESSHLPHALRTGEGVTPTRWDEGLNAFARLENDDTSLQLWLRWEERSSSEGGYTPMVQFTDYASWGDYTFSTELANRMQLLDNTDLRSSLSFAKYETLSDNIYVWPISDVENYKDDYKYAKSTAVTLEEVVSVDVSDTIDVLVGAVASHYNVIPKCTISGALDSDDELVAQGGTFTYYTERGNPDSKVEINALNNIVYQSVGAFAEGQWDIISSLRAVAGIRVDDDSRYDEVPVSPRAALIYSVNDNLNVKYIYTRAFVAPSAYNAYLVWRNAISINVPNPDLEPEEAESNEIVINYQVSRNLCTKLALYYTTIDNMIIIGDRYLDANIVTKDAYLSPDGSDQIWISRSVNGECGTSMGYDLSGEYQLGRVATIWGSYSWLDSETEMGGVKSPQAGISEHNIRLGTTYRGIKALRVTPSLVHRSTPEFTGNAWGLDGKLKNPYQVNLHVAYTPSERLSFNLNVLNLTNNKYALVGVFAPIPQETRSVTASVGYSF